MSSPRCNMTACLAINCWRNATRLAQQYRLPQDAKPSFSDPGVGLGPFTPDTRSKAQREVEQASGRIDAMNRSIARRECGKPG